MLRQRTLARDTTAAAYVEFLLAFVPLFLLFMGVIQVALVFGARLVVQHAAFRAVRSAAVVVDDDPRYYDREDRGSLEGRSATVMDVRHRLSRMGVGVGRGGIGADEPLATPLSRRATVELAAALVLLPLSQKSGLSVDSAIGSEGLDASATDVLDRMELRFIDFPSGASEVTRYGRDGSVTVELTYRYPCSVPVARALVCPDGHKEIVVRRSLPIHGAPIDYQEGWPRS